VEVQRLRDGLWRWTAPHPDWDPRGEGSTAWPEQVGCVYYEAPSATVLIDPLVPQDATEAARFYDALDRDVKRRGLPVAILQTIFWHDRSSETLRDRYATTDTLPDGVAEIRFGDPREEVAFVIAEHRALVIGDMVIGSDTMGTAPAGGVLVAPASWHRDTPEQAAWFASSLSAALEPLAACDAELVLVAHGTAVVTDGAAALRAAIAAFRERA
jgi:hypothetical protein